VRLRQLLESIPGKFVLVHRSFVLRPEINPDATFAEYHLGHRARAKEMTGLPYALPEVGAPYPNSSWPALFASKWIAREHPDKFECFDAALFRAFFERAENIGDAEVLKRLAQSCDIDPAVIDKALSDETIKQAVRSDHNQAQQMGIHGIPAVIIGDQVISGAVSLDVYVAAAQRVLS
jgi:predicted DsbA family dithiol-disulfide isomerase